MHLILAILTNTPVWAYVALAYLVLQGLLALRPRTVSITRIMLVPVIFIVLGVSRALVGDGGPWVLVAWAAGVVVLVPVGLLTAPHPVRVDRARGLITRRGSIIPLIRNVTVFMSQYAAAVLMAFHPEDHSAIAVTSRAVAGAAAGYFIGWSIAFLRHYRSAPS
jgi:hypothetical protein